MQRWRVMAACASFLVAGCPFDPTPVQPSNGSDTSTGTGTDASASSSVTTTSADTSTSADATTVDTSESASSSTGDDVPDWGEGDPPDFGDLGPDGEGSILVVHALDLTDSVDVWLVGSSAPSITGVAPDGASLLRDVPRDARRVVLARAGTLEAVGCSDWFPLRADEQWAVVAARESHGCATPVPDGKSLTFEQELPLSGNPLRFVHAAAPDDLTVVRDGAPEAGTLAPLETLGVEALPDCESSGCAIAYQLRSDVLGHARDFSFLATQVADLPPAGEVLLVARGDVREEWPNQPEAMRLVRVDIDARTQPIGRDPELAVLTAAVDVDVEFSILTPPLMTAFAVVPPCDSDACVAPVQRFVPGSREIFAQPTSGTQIGEVVELAGGRRYLLWYTAIDGGELTLVEDELDRTDDTVAIGRGFNVVAPAASLTIGRVFANMGQAFDAFVDIPTLGVTVDEELPTKSWQLVFATDGQPLGASCFYFAETPVGWRGLVGPGLLVGIDVWPPVQSELVLACF